jgi:hypothetical protein
MSGVVVAGELGVDLVVEVVDMEELQITAQFATEQIMCGVQQLDNLYLSLFMVHLGQPDQYFQKIGVIQEHSRARSWPCYC